MKNKSAIFLLIAIFSFPLTGIFSQNAPITTAGSVQACPDSIANIPIIVTNFTSISALTLRLDYNPNYLTFQTVTHINPALNNTGVYFFDTHVSDTLHKIMIAWTDITPLTLANGSKIFDVQLYYLSGSPSVRFNNTSNAGADCEYANAGGLPLNDLPTSTYYINSQVTGSPQVGAAGTITGTSTVCQGQTGVIYSVAPISNAQWYTWSIPEGATIISGSASNTITVNFSTSAISGNVTVYGSNLCGTGTPSPAFPVTVVALPGPAGTITGTATVCQGQTGVVYSVPPIANAQWYTWSVPPGATITSGSLSNSISVDFSTSASTGNISVFGSNSCGDGTASPNFPVAVMALPGAAGSITGPATVQQGQTGVQYSVTPVANATGYTWSLPAGATITSGTNSSTITVSFSMTATGGPITVYATNSCGNGAISPAFTVTVQIPAQLVLTNLIITSGTTVCYNATQTITLAGNGTYFTVQNGAIVTLIAGQNILMLPGTSVQPGGYMHAYITTTGQYCSAVPGMVATPENETITENTREFIPFIDRLNAQCIIYPNPTSGTFTLELSGLEGSAATYVEIYSIMGEKITGKTLYGMAKEVFSLSDRPSGLYIVKVASEGFSKILKVVKP